jgi:uncharacterized protein YndB with AHSA1/START domain
MNLTDLTVSRAIPASTEKVFEVWIDPKSPGGPWFGADRVILNPVADGLFYLAVKHEGRTWPHYGRFLQIERPRVVEYTWVSEATKGAESVVTVTIEARGEQNRSHAPPLGRARRRDGAPAQGRLGVGTVRTGGRLRLTALGFFFRLEAQSGLDNQVRLGRHSLASYLTTSSVAHFSTALVWS